MDMRELSQKPYAYSNLVTHAARVMYGKRGAKAHFQLPNRVPIIGPVPIAY